MAVFALISDKPQADLRGAVDRIFDGKSFHVNGCVSMVMYNGTARTLSEVLGVKHTKADGSTVGSITDVIVTQLAPSYWGWANSELWTWLKNAHEWQGV
jgi:hypothetical protein